MANLGNLTEYNDTLGFSNAPYYFNIRSVDNAGNWASTYQSYGPVGMDTIPGAVSGLALAKSGNDISISRNYTSNADYYRVYRATTPLLNPKTQVSTDVTTNYILDTGELLDSSALIQ